MTKIKTPRGAYTARILSAQLWCLPTHWAPRHNRTLICPRLHCPACRQERAKIRGYAIGRVRGVEDERPGLLELPAGLLDQLHKLGLKEHDEAAGWAWTAEPADGHGHRVRGASRCELHDLEVAPTEVLAAAIDKLFNLPAPCWIDRDGVHYTTDRDEWLERHHDALLRRANAAFQIERTMQA